MTKTHAFQILLFLGLSLAPLAVLSQPTHPLQVKQVKADWQAARSILKVEIDASIQAPWHVYADSVEQDYLVATGLVIDTSLGKLVKKQFPKPVVKTLVGEKVPLFEGQFKFAEFFYIKSNKSFPITLELQYQSCSNEMCLPPKKHLIEVLKTGDKVSARVKG